MEEESDIGTEAAEERADERADERDVDVADDRVDLECADDDERTEGEVLFWFFICHRLVFFPNGAILVYS